MESLTQAQAAEQMGVSPEAYRTWESGERSPTDRMVPTITAFLGYDPLAVNEPTSLAAMIRHHRRQRGLSREAMARHMGVDPYSVKRWEEGGRMTAGSEERVRKLLERGRCGPKS